LRRALGLVGATPLHHTPLAVQARHIALSALAELVEAPRRAPPLASTLRQAQGSASGGARRAHSVSHEPLARRPFDNLTIGVT
ncbi:hypothetical protein, partial [Candidatus Viridilinea mediisalina]